jgi:DNA-cytosine methyltransferase
MANFPNTIQLGSVVDLDTSKLPKIDLLIGGSPCQSFSFAGKRNGMTTKDNIEILELSQYLKLKEENFQFEGQSYLFWEYMRILNEVKPKYFLLENVTMAERWSKILTKAIGVSPILINSSLISAQNRERLYWTNIGLEPTGLFGDLHSIIEQPKDKQLILKDILLENPDPKYYVSDKVMAWIQRPRHSFKLDIRSEHQKGKTVLVGGRGNTDLVKIKEVVGLKEVRSEEAKQIRKENNKKGIDTNPYRKKDLIERNDGKTGAILTSLTNDNLIKESLLVEDLSIYKRNSIITHNQNQIVSVRKNEVDIPNLQILLKKHKKKGITIDFIAKSLNVPKTMVEHWFRTDSGFSIPNPEIWLSLKELLSIENNDFDASIMEFEEKEGNYDKANRIYDEEGKSATLTLQSNNDKILSRDKVNSESNNYRIRRLTPIECERLQTVPDNYTSFVSDTQRYKMLGNGWTIDVIAHIFSYIKK